MPLSDKDRREIKSGMVPKAACYVIIGGFFLIWNMGGGIYPGWRGKPIIFMSNSLSDILSWAVPSLVFTIILGYAAYRIINSSRRQTLKAGRKKVEKVILENKDIYGSSYYFIIKGKRHKTDEITFNSMEKGDRIEMHYTRDDILGFHPIETQITNNTKATSNETIINQ